LPVNDITKIILYNLFKKQAGFFYVNQQFLNLKSKIMKCPNCEQVLQIMEKQNVEIDYCPNCRGVWLDKEELDKVIDFSNQQLSRGLKQNNKDGYDNHRDSNKRENENNKHMDTKEDYYTKNKRKKSFLGDLFDF
jgi:Zn-finger nucleic acid-binding protein